LLATVKVGRETRLRCRMSAEYRQTAVTDGLRINGTATTSKGSKP
jgi:hypothetical protein